MITVSVFDAPFLSQGKPVVPAVTDLLQQLESTDFDQQPAQTVVSVWSDKSGRGNDMILGGGGITGSDHGPYVDTGVRAGGHVTLHFGGTNALRSVTKFIPAEHLISGLEIFAIFRNQVDPPPLTSEENSVFQYTQVENQWLGAPLWIWTALCPQQPNRTGTPYGIPTGHWVEQFANGWHQDLAHQITLDLGATAVNTASQFVAYNVSAAADNSSYKAWMNYDNFCNLTAGQYNFTSSGYADFYAIGGAVRLGLGGSFAHAKCNLAAIFLWQRQLSAAERQQMRRYAAQVYGVSFAMPQSIYDNFQDYLAGAQLNGLNGGTGYVAAYVDRTGYAALRASDYFETYSNGTNLDGLNGGSGWSGPFVDR